MDGDDTETMNGDTETMNGYNRETTIELDDVLTFTSAEEFLTTVYDRDKDFSVWTDVSPSAFRQIDSAREEHNRHVVLHYREATRLLYATVSSYPHEQAAESLNYAVKEQIESMVGAGAWRSPRNTTFKNESSPDAGSGEGDAGGLPRPRPDGRRWPTLVIEVGNSQSQVSLHTTMQWWFAASQHAVKIVVLVKLYPQRREMVVDKYAEERGFRSRPSAPFTRPDLIPVLKQTISASPISGTSPMAYSVTGEALTLDFSLLFLRPADARQGEGDVVISTERLQLCSEMIWDFVPGLDDGSVLPV